MQTGKRKSKRGIGIIMELFTLLCFPLTSQAFCTADCQNQPTTTNFMDRSTIGYQSNDRRVGSHNFGEGSTAILGDVNLRVGHEHVEIKGMENSPHSIIDNSINSTVILGNMKQ